MGRELSDGEISLNDRHHAGIYGIADVEHSTRSACPGISKA
jgi:hypothetical protein